ncbi:hypothetical protein J4558_13385 [Leptolyngbya sp. 15MV]|nr:hypothetical protein J4558_13385 [Leptolyngbya sp. 15MV]
MAEGASAAILAAEADGGALEEQRAEGETLGIGVGDGAAGGQGGACGQE